MTLGCCQLLLRRLATADAAIATNLVLAARAKTRAASLKLTWAMLGGDPAARSHRVEQLSAATFAGTWVETVYVFHLMQFAMRLHA